MSEYEYIIKKIDLINEKITINYHKINDESNSIKDKAITDERLLIKEFQEDSKRQIYIINASLLIAAILFIMSIIINY
jgi:hypothetical protein